MSRSLSVALCLSAAWFSLFPTLSAQTMFGRISGTVSDPSGATIPGAKVIVTNTDTQASRTLTTDDHGFYVAENLAIGPYSVTVDAPGFKRSQQAGNFVVADGRLTVDFKLQMGDASQTVDVVAEQSESLNTVSAEIAQVVDKNQVENLALNGRNYMELLTLVPGAVDHQPRSVQRHSPRSAPPTSRSTAIAPTRTT